MAGFECSCHRPITGQRLDLLEATFHTQHTRADFQRVRDQGITTVRSGIRWHLIETRPYHYDFSSLLPLVRCAKSMGMQVIWDLCHYGWPDDLDIFSAEYIRRFERLTAAVTRLLTNEVESTPYLTPINEISYLSWAAGDEGRIYPYSRGRGIELKMQLVRATIAAIEAIWQVAPDARIAVVEPVINIVPHPQHLEERQAVEEYRLAQYQAWDMVAGRIFPELGGQERYLDLVGVNYYAHNQWIDNGRTLGRRNRLYKPFRHILEEVYDRYGRPLFIAETGTEGDRRPGWLRYVGREVRAAICQGIPVEGICLYPILDHPGWENDRYCPNGLWGYANQQGERPIHLPYAQELARQQRLFARLTGKTDEAHTERAAAINVSIERPAVCLFTDSREPSGLGEHMLTLAAQLLPRYRVLFVCPCSPRGLRILDRAKLLGCTTLALPTEAETQADEMLATWLQRMQVAVFHCHAGIGWEGHNGVNTARESEVPVVIRTEHLPYLLTDRDQQAAYRRLIQDVDRFIFVSAEARQTHLAAGVPKTKASLVRNGIVTPRVRPDRRQLRREFGLPVRAKVVFTAARMTAQKGHCYLVEAAPQILDAVPNTYFLWAGDGPEEPALRRQIAALGIDPDHILFAGWRTDAHHLLAASDLFVLPSLFEGLPLVALEALSLGVPVVGTRVCGTSEVIEDGVCGGLVEPGDSKALATTIVKALRQPDLRKGWAQAGRKRFQQLFTAERMACETAEVYETLRAAATN
jgi:glycosyltransferase involved in cell wall biosynthesis